MKVRITRPVVITGDGGLRSLAPGLVVDVEGEALDQIMRQQGGGPPEQPKPRGMPPVLVLDLTAAFADVNALQKQRRQTAGQTLNMQERLLNGFLAGAIEEKVFHLKMAKLKRELAETETGFKRAEKHDPEGPIRAMALFNFSQNLVNPWSGSNSEAKGTF